MDFSLVELTPEQQAFAEDVRRTLDELITEDVHEHERRTGDGFNERVHLALGERGWLVPDWPVEQGGAGLDKVSQKILQLELDRRHYINIPGGTTRLVWSAVERYAEPELREELRIGIAKGTVRFCLGYTEPDGGSDIAAAKVRAVRDGDEWILNGSKMFTTGAHVCQYVFLITRTDPELPKHKGLTMFLVPLNTEGVDVQAIHTYGGERTNATYYGDVRLSDRYRLGPVNDGWSVLHGPLDEEHSIGRPQGGLEDLSIGRNFVRSLETALDATVEWARTAERPDGTSPADDNSVLQRLGWVAAELEAGINTPGPMGRVKGSLALVEGSAVLLDVLGPEGLVHVGGTGAVGEGAADYAHRYAQGTATYGGTVEIFRTIIAQHHLGLPRATFPGSRAFIQKSSTTGR